MRNTFSFYVNLYVNAYGYSGEKMKKKDLTYFVRFGALSLNKQKGFGETAFHSPPAPRGFYAFPYTVQSLFLVAGLERTQPHQFPVKKLREYNEHWSEEEEQKWFEERDAIDWDSYYSRGGKVMRNIRREFKKKEGNIWHHLGDYVDNAEVLARHNAWVKTPIKAWQKAFKKCTLDMRYGRGESSVKSINESPKTCGDNFKDKFEVFFDEK